MSSNLPWSNIPDNDNNPVVEEYYPYLTTVYILSPDRYIINHITLGEHPFYLFHLNSYIMIPANFANDACIGARLDTTSYDKVVDTYFSNKQKIINQMIDNIAEYDTREIVLHKFHDIIKHPNANIPEFIRKDLEENHNKINSYCSCNLSNNNVKIVPPYSPFPYTGEEGMKYLEDVFIHEKMKLCHYNADVDWMLSTSITPLQVNNISFEINKVDVVQSIEQDQIKYKKWCNIQMDNMIKALYEKLKEENL